MLDLVNVLLTAEQKRQCICSQLYDVKGLITFIWSIINIIKFAIPILLIILGMLDLGKAVTSGEDKEIKAAQQLLVKRAISGIAVFFVVSIVQLVLSIIPMDNDSGFKAFVCKTKDIEKLEDRDWYSSTNKTTCDKMISIEEEIED